MKTSVNAFIAGCRWYHASEAPDGLGEGLDLDTHVLVFRGYLKGKKVTQAAAYLSGRGCFWMAQLGRELRPFAAEDAPLQLAMGWLQAVARAEAMAGAALLRRREPCPFSFIERVPAPAHAEVA